MTDEEKAHNFAISLNCESMKMGELMALRQGGEIGYLNGLAEGRKEGYEQGKKNERKLQCGKKNYEKDIARLEKENEQLKAQNEKMRCCENCKNRYSCHYESIDELARIDCGKDFKSWELAE